MQKKKRGRFIGTKAIILLATALLIQIAITYIDDPEHFLSPLTTAPIITSKLIPIASGAVSTDNINTINIKDGSGVASAATPLHPSILYLHKGDTVRWGK